MVTLFLIAALGQGTFTEDAFVVRSAFMGRLQKVERGMTFSQVKAILGKPEDRIAYPAPSAYESLYQNGQTTWTYGSDRHLGYPTMGYVTFDSKGTVGYVRPESDTAPPPVGLFAEGRMRQLLCEMARLSKDSSKNMATLRMANLLQPLGKTAVLALVREYFRIDARWQLYMDEEVPLLALRVLFDCPKMGHIRMRPIGPETPAPKNLYAIYPRYPVVLEGDLPFVLDSWEFRGMHPNDELPAPTPDETLQYYGRYGVLRKTPLTPTGNPVRSMFNVLMAKSWPFNRAFHVKTARLERNWDPRNRMREPMENDVLHLLRTVQKFPEWDGATSPAEWDRLRSSAIHRAAKLAVRWDSAKQSFVLPNGATVAQEDDAEYPEFRWKPKCLADIKGEISYERTGARLLYGRHYELAEAMLVAPALAEFYDTTTGKLIGQHTFPVECRDSDVATLEKGGSPKKVRATSGGNGSGGILHFKRGHGLKIVITREGKRESTVIADVTKGPQP